MSSQRSSGRVSKPKKWFDELTDPDKQLQQVTVKTERVRSRGKPLKPILTVPTVGPSIDQLITAPLPIYQPPITVPLTPYEANQPPQSPIDTFLSLLGEPALKLIVDNTNSYARHYRLGPLQQGVRLWHNTTRNELLCWIGLLFYMGRHIERERSEYWTVSSHNIGRYMGKSRWDQIHRYLSIRDEISFPTTLGDPWYSKLEPVISQIRYNCERAVKPYS
jgi:hypothetical protein